MEGFYLFPSLIPLFQHLYSFPYQVSYQALEEAAQGSGGVTISGDT